MPVEQPPQNFAPDNPDRSAHKDTHPRQGAVRVVDVPAAPAVLTIDMAAIGLAGRHVRVRVTGNPCAFFMVGRSSDAVPTYPIPDSTQRATFSATGAQTANPATQATQLPAGGEARRYVSPRFPILRMNGVGGVAVLELEDATI